MPVRQLSEKAQRHIVWNAQSSIIINGQRSFTVGWGFTIESENFGIYIQPIIIAPSEFHSNAIQYLEY